MALVMLPCELPWWSTLQMYLQRLEKVTHVEELIDGMLTIHNMCNVGLDPDEPETPDLTIFDGLRTVLTDQYTDDERAHLFGSILPNMVTAASNLKFLKPAKGLQFSLQQQVSHLELNRHFVRSLIAHCFFSTFPKRTNKTHPTLQDFNFTYFFNHLNQKFQKAKLASFFHYFDLKKDEFDNLSPNITITRQVMTGIEWLTIDDWLECSLPLCPLIVKHESRTENADPNNLFVCFSSKKLGARTLIDGSSKECIQFMTHPELLVTLLCVEALEDNEVITIEGTLQTGRINNPRQKGTFEPASKINLVSFCCMDAENYCRHPFRQYEEDNVLRELNKALLGFRQKQQQLLHHTYHQPVMKRLSPIGESFSTTPTENNHPNNNNNHRENQNNINNSSNDSNCINNSNERIVHRTKDDHPRPFGKHLSKGKFIILGSSGEMLPVCRRSPLMTNNSEYSSCHSITEDDEPSSSSSSSSPPEEYFTACTSIPEDNEDADEEANARRYSGQLDTMEHRTIFAERLKEALRRAQSSSTSDSSYAVDISVSGSSIADPNIRMKRGGSRGFMLEESVEESETSLPPILPQQRKEDSADFDGMIADKMMKSESAEDRRNKGGSSKYSFSTDYSFGKSCELDSVYGHLNQWLEEIELGGRGNSLTQQSLRDNAVIQFAGGLLKRTLSESFVGVPLTEGVDGNDDDQIDDDLGPLKNRRNCFKVKMAARSLSLELAKHKHRLAAQLISMIGQKQIALPGSILPIVTGNWGCGSRHLGDPQMKVLIQWTAASVAGVPNVIYYTCSNQKLLKLDTLCRVLLDRRWNVGELIKAMLAFTSVILSPCTNVDCDRDFTLFDSLMNTDDKVNRRYNKFLTTQIS